MKIETPLMKRLHTAPKIPSQILVGPDLFMLTKTVTSTPTLLLQGDNFEIFLQKLWIKDM